MTLLFDALVIGLLDAAPLILAAIGFTLIYYLSGFINVAYSETITLGAFAAVVLNTSFGWNFYATIIPAALLSGVLSVLTFLVVFRPALRRGVGPTEMIVLSVGLSFFLRYAARLGFGVELYQFDVADPSYLSLFGTGVTSAQLTALAMVAVIAAGLYLLIYRTRYGEMIRALASNADLAAASGIDATRVAVLVWFLAGVAGGLAGVFLGVFAFVGYLLGWELILIVIMVTIVGGIGNLGGAVVAGIAAGVLTAGLTLVTEPLYAQIALLLAFIAVLRLRARPGGLPALLPHTAGS